MKTFSNNNLKQFFNIHPMLKISVAKISRSVCELQSHRFSILLALSISLFAPTNVFSAAGDPISTTATIDYVIGGTPTTTTANNTFLEDRRINFVVTEANGGLTVPVIDGLTSAVMPFLITNNGNDTQDFLIAAQDAVSNPFGLPADTFDPVAVQTFVESGATPGYQLGQDTDEFVDELAPSDSRIVYIIADMPPTIIIPPTIVVDDVASMLLIAQVAEGGGVGVEGAFINSDDNGRISPDSGPAGDFTNSSTNVPAGTPSSIADTTAMETVFNDPAGLSPEDWSTAQVLDITGNGQHSDAGAFQVRPPINIVKTVTVIDTLGGNDPHPGATLRYQLVVTVDGTIAIDDLDISDAIPANTTYVAESIVLNGVVQTDLSDSVPAPAVDFSNTSGVAPVTAINVDLSEGGTVAISSGSTNTIIFEVTID